MYTIYSQQDKKDTIRKIDNYKKKLKKFQALTNTN